MKCLDNVKNFDLAVLPIAIDGASINFKLLKNVLLITNDAKNENKREELMWNLSHISHAKMKIYLILFFHTSQNTLETIS